MKTLLIAVCLVLTLTACDSGGESSEVDANLCLEKGMTKQEAVQALDACARSGEIAPKPLGEYVPSSADAETRFAAADSLHIQGPYLPAEGSHAVFAAHFERGAAPRFELNVAASTLDLAKPFSGVRNKDEFKRALDRFLAENSGYKAYMQRADWYGVKIEGMEQEELDYVLGFDDWLVQVVHIESTINTCILAFTGGHLYRLHCDESAL